MIYTGYYYCLRRSVCARFMRICDAQTTVICKLFFVNNTIKHKYLMIWMSFFYFYCCTAIFISIDCEIKLNKTVVGIGISPKTILWIITFFYGQFYVWSVIN